MTSDEFWNDDPDLFWAYRFSYIKKIEENQQLANINAWLQGGYIYEAITIALSNAFTEQKRDYRDTPYKIKEDTSKETSKQNTLDDRLKMRVQQIQEIMR